MEYKNETPFKMYIDWCEVSRVKMEYNKISFGMRITVLMKKQLYTNGFECVKKDANKMTTLCLSEFKKYFVNLNGVEFGDQEEDDEVESFLFYTALYTDLPTYALCLNSFYKLMILFLLFFSIS